ncbi:Imm61 family immunity protein [Mycolicibacterium aubagnense]
MSISRQLEEWANLAKFSLTRNTEGSDADIFWNLGGELRYFVRGRADGWTQVTCSDRLGPEVFEFSGASPSVVERFLLGWFGDTYRSVRALPILARPIAGRDLANGHRISLQEFDGVDRYTSVDATDRTIAVSSGGRLMAPDRLTRLSVLLHAPVDKIEESFRREDGSPLFGVRG